MSIQSYLCTKDGEFEHKQSIKSSVTQTLECPKCGEDSKHIFYPPTIRVIRTWNDGANEIRRDPYTQAKSQLNSTVDEFKNQGVDVPKGKDKTYIKMAEAIDNSKGKKPLTEKQRVIQFDRQRRKKENANRTRN